MKGSVISLKDLQHWMKWIITDPRGVDEALTSPNPTDVKFVERYTEPMVSARTLVSAAGKSKIEDRLSVYAEGYFARILESLESDFERVRLILGEFAFQKLVVDYLKVFPSRTTNIGEIGKYLAEFITDYDELKDIKYLSELAAFEWKMIEVFYSKDSKVFDPAILDKIPENAWETIRINFDSSVVAVDSIWPLDLFWDLQELPVHEFIPLPMPHTFIFWRKDGVVHFRKSTAVEKLLISKFREQETLLTCLESISNSEAEDSSSEDKAALVMGFFSSWVSEKMLSELIIQTTIVNKHDK